MPVSSIEVLGMATRTDPWIDSRDVIGPYPLPVSVMEGSAWVEVDTNEFRDPAQVLALELWALFPGDTEWRLQMISVCQGGSVDRNGGLRVPRVAASFSDAQRRPTHLALIFRGVGTIRSRVMVGYRRL